MPVSARRQPKPKMPAAPQPKAAGNAAAMLAIVALLAGAALVVALLVVPALRGPAPLAANDGAPGVVARVESLYNDITLTRRADGHFVLSFGADRLNYVESIVDPKDQLALPVTYTQSMTAGLAYAASLDDAVIIGLGGGRTAWYHHKSVPEMDMTAVELDPEVARIAEEYFGVKPEPGFAVEVLDGRVWLTRTEQTFDIILVDAYRGPFVPFHLLTAEFYKLVASRLKPGGVAVQNIEPTTMLFDPAVATIRSAFEHLVFLEGRGNIVVIAYNGPEKTDAEVRRIAAERHARYGLRYDLGEILDRRFTPAVKPAAPLTDDFAPVEYLKAVERHNEKRGAPAR